ncbi:MAG: alpha-amylase family glycosyl hydrolase [Bacteroidota bacterium]
MSERLRATVHPLLYEVNTRVLLGELSASAGKPVTLAGIPERILDEWAGLGFDCIWMMGVWTAGPAVRRMARAQADLQEVCRKALPDLAPADILGSPYAVSSYTVPARLGGGKGLLQFRKKLEKRGMGLVLDFVPNHSARDHRWVRAFPGYYVQGTEALEREQPAAWFRSPTREGERVLAHGRDPFFPGWTDTAQLNYRNPRLRKAMIRELEKVAGWCDGVRCDMAMLVLSDVFERTWEAAPRMPWDDGQSGEFWSEAIGAVRSRREGFLFVAEAYWDLEWRLQKLGFDYTYDKRMYDRLLREGAGSVYDHLKAPPEYQSRCLRFIENHDEPRAAALLDPEPWHRAAALVASSVPGMVLFHEGQLEGRRIRVPVQLGRRPPEEPSGPLRAFYGKLLGFLSGEPFRHGRWLLAKAGPAWGENPTWTNFLSFWWQSSAGKARFIVVNYAPINGQAYLRPPVDLLEGMSFEFRDLLSPTVYVRERASLDSRGMYFDLPPYGMHLFDVRPARRP